MARIPGVQDVTSGYADSKDRSVTLMYMGKMDDMKMKDDNMMEDDKMMEDDMMMKDDKMMEETMMPAGKTIKLWIGSKKIMVDGIHC